MSKFIKIDTCVECPRCGYEDGRGYCDEFWKCQEYGYILNEIEGFNFRTGIYEKCQLENLP